MKLSDYIANFISKKTQHVFVGQEAVVHLLDSLSKIKKNENCPLTNEQGTAIAADAYSRLNNNYGVVNCN